VSTSRSAWSRTIAGLLAGQVLVIAGFIVFFVVEALRGEAAELSAVFTSVLIFALGAGGLAALARAWWAGQAWPRTPSLVWHALLVPIGWSLAQTRHGLIAAAVLVVAVVGLVGAYRAGADSQE
jgi:hypothetical protein